MRLKISVATCALAVVLATLLCVPASAQQPSGDKPVQPPGDKPAAYQAAAVKPICANCHEQQHSSIDFTAHGAKNDANGSMCQACHGDATLHLQDPIKNKPIGPLTTKGATAEEKAAVCLTCHVGNRQLAFWESGKHAKNEVSCNNCHNIHGTPGNVPVSKFVTSFRANEADICGTCHQQIRTEIMKPSHHPIIENKIKCSDCHNPHGALTPAMLKAETVNQQCYSCHADKRGPFVFQHPAVEENCLSCHNPHGSVFARLLNEKVPNLCQDCHDVARHPGTPYGAGAGFVCAPGDTTPQCAGQTGAFNANVSTRFIARGCLNCHNAIHGSNAPASRGMFFTR